MRYRQQRSRGEKCKFNRFVSYQLAAYIMRMFYLLENIRPEGRHVFGMNSFLSTVDLHSNLRVGNYWVGVEYYERGNGS